MGTSAGGVAGRGTSGWGADTAIGGGEAGDGTGVCESKNLRKLIEQ